MSNVDQLEADVQAARDQLAQLEQEHVDLTLELNEFETLYNARVGPIQARLEEAQLHVEEYRLRVEMIRLRGRSLSPTQLEAEVEYRLHDKRSHAQATYEQAERAQSEIPPEPIDVRQTAQLNLKQVYRELAKQVHPDLALDAVDRAQREQRMKEINTLYAKHDLETLQQRLRDIDAEQQRQREDPAQRYARLKDEYDRIVAAIKRAKAEIAELNHSPMMSLKLDAALARARGRDVLGEVAAQVQAQVFEAERELHQLILTFRELVESSGLTA